MPDFKEVRKNSVHDEFQWKKIMIATDGCFGALENKKETGGLQNICFRKMMFWK